MMSRRLVVWKLTFIMSVAALCPATWAQMANLGDNIRTAANVGPFRNQIEDFVRQRMQKLAGTDAAAQSQAREELVNAVVPPAAGQLSGQFLDAYASILSGELVKLASHKEPRVRLNAAIAAAKVAEGAKNARLQPAMAALLKDQSDAVVLWALRGSKAVLPHAIAAGGAADLLASIVKIGQERPSVARAVYDTLSLEGDTRAANEAITAMQSVLRARIDKYKNGLPAEPFADTRATTYLVGRALYSEANKVSTAQLISDLLHVAAQRSADVSGAQRVELANTITSVGKALAVVGQWENNPTIEQTGLAISRIHAATAAPEELQAAVKPVHGHLKAIPKFSKITPPPTIGAMASGDSMGGGSSPPTTSSSAANGPK